MHDKTTNTLLLGGLAVLTLLVTVAANNLAGLDAKIASVLLRNPSQVSKMQTVTQVVALPEGGTVTVSTTRFTPENPNETVAEWKARHKEAVDGWKNG